MLAKVHSAAVLGIDSYPIEIEVNAGWGQPAVIIVGLPDAAVKESRDRVKTAIENSGFKYVMGRTTINLAPADVHTGRKGRSRSDLQWESRTPAVAPGRHEHLRLVP
jgi:hypothetical protein